MMQVKANFSANHIPVHLASPGGSMRQMVDHTCSEYNCSVAEHKVAYYGAQWKQVFKPLGISQK